MQQAILKVEFGRPSAFRRDALLQVRDDRRWNNKSDGTARLEGVSFANVADLHHIRFHQPQSVHVDCPIPLFEDLLDDTGGRSDPLKLEVEDRGGIVEDIVMENNALGLVAINMYEGMGYSVFRRVREYYGTLGVGKGGRDEEDAFGEPYVLVHGCPQS